MNPGPSVVVSIMVSQRSDEKRVAFLGGWGGGAVGVGGASWAPPLGLVVMVVMVVVPIN